MFISFFESFKYAGHQWPVSLLRIYVGYFFLNAGLSKVQNHFLTTPVLSNTINTWLAAGPHNSHYATFLQEYVLTHWQAFSYLVVISEIMVGICYIIGFGVRFSAIVAMFLNLNFLMASSPDLVNINKIFFALNATFFALSAGRCIGFDYYFYKKLRGFWW